MSSELPLEFQYLLFFAALSGRAFSKSDLGVKINTKQIDDLAEQTRLLDVKPKGNSRLLSSNEETLRWAGAHLNVELSGKNKALLAILHLIRAKTDAYLKANQLSLADFLAPAPPPDSASSAQLQPTSDKVEPAPLNASTTVEAVRRAYLSLSGGAYEARVLLKDLRKQLTVRREDQDAVFMEMIASGEADFYPEDDPMSRDEEDERAALVLADRRRHLLRLHREPSA